MFKENRLWFFLLLSDCELSRVSMVEFGCNIPYSVRLVLICLSSRSKSVFDQARIPAVWKNMAIILVFADICDFSIFLTLIISFVSVVLLFSDGFISFVCWSARYLFLSSVSKLNITYPSANTILSSVSTIFLLLTWTVAHFLIPNVIPTSSLNLLTSSAVLLIVFFL